MKRWIWNVLIWIDQGANAIFGWLFNLLMKPTAEAQFGNPDETLSSVFGKNAALGKCPVCIFMCRILHKIDKHHCQESIEYDPDPRH